MQIQNVLLHYQLYAALTLSHFSISVFFCMLNQSDIHPPLSQWKTTPAYNLLPPLPFSPSLPYSGLRWNGTYLLIYSNKCEACEGEGVRIFFSAVSLSSHPELMKKYLPIILLNEGWSQASGFNHHASSFLQVFYVNASRMCLSDR